MRELNEDEKKYQIALTLIEGVGDVIGKKLLAFTGSAKAVFFAKRSELEKIEGIGKILVKAILSADVLTSAVQELKWMEKEGVTFILCR